MTEDSPRPSKAQRLGGAAAAAASRAALGLRGGSGGGTARDDSPQRQQRGRPPPSPAPAPARLAPALTAPPDVAVPASDATCVQPTLRDTQSEADVADLTAPLVSEEDAWAGVEPAAHKASGTIEDGGVRGTSPEVRTAQESNAACCSLRRRG